MTATDQDEAAERAAQELARRLRGFVPESLLADPLAFARTYWDDARAEHWKCIPPPKPVALARQPGVPAEAHATELEAVRRRCETASGKHRSRETPAAKAAITRKDDHDA